MFGLNKIKGARRRAEDTLTKLLEMQFEGESLNGLVKASFTGNKKFTSINISEAVIRVRPREEVELMIVQAVNEALSKVEYAQSNLFGRNSPGLDFRV
jgi:DNA-binding protein YbaB